jgi:RyR domain
VLREQVRRLGRPASGQTAAEDIARVIHAANRELQIVQGDPRPSPPWDEAPEYQVRENVASVVAALADPERTPEQSHQGWYERLIEDGWQHGPVKDETAKTHPDLVPFDQLLEHEKQKDRLFMAIVRALAPEPRNPVNSHNRARTSQDKPLLQVSLRLQGRTFGAPKPTGPGRSGEDARDEHGERERAGQRAVAARVSGTLAAGGGAARPTSSCAIAHRRGPLPAAPMPRTPP